MEISFKDATAFVREATPFVLAVSGLIVALRSRKTARAAEKRSIKAEGDAKDAARVQVNFALRNAVTQLKAAELVPADFSFSPVLPSPLQEGGNHV